MGGQLLQAFFKTLALTPYLRWPCICSILQQGVVVLQAIDS